MDSTRVLTYELSFPSPKVWTPQVPGTKEVKTSSVLSPFAAQPPFSNQPRVTIFPVSTEIERSPPSVSLHSPSLICSVAETPWQQGSCDEVTKSPVSLRWKITPASPVQ